MERESVILKHEMHEKIVQPFLKDAFKEGAHRIMPKRSPQDRWLRQIMIGVVYNDIGSSARVAELAEKHGIFKQSITESNKAFLRNLWNNCSPEIQKRYPLNDVLTARKPWSQKSKENASETRGGVSSIIKQQIVKEGIIDIYSISETTGVPVRKILKSRELLASWGVDIPRKYSSYRGLLKTLAESTDDEKIQQLLDQFPYYVILKDINTSRRVGRTPRFLALRTLAMDAGFHYHPKYNDLFASSLRKAGIPITIKSKYTTIRGSPVTLRYYILSSRDKERAKQALREDQDLQKFQKTTL